MTTPDPQSFEYARLFVDQCEKRARALFAETGRVDAVTFILARRHPDTRAPFPRPTFLLISLGALMGGFGKDIANEVLRQMCEKTEALAIVNVAEAWSAVHEKVNGVYDASTPPSEAENREKIVFISLEHVSGTNSWAIPVVHVEGDPPTLGEPRETGTLDLGRMTGLLKKEMAEA